jgi:hypothetical protein
MRIDKTANSTSRVWAVFSNNTGVVTDAGTYNVTIYPANSDTPTINNASMSRLGTGVYYYPFNVSALSDGVYTANFNFFSDGTYFDGVEPISINSGLSDGDFNKAYGSIGRLYANFSGDIGQEQDIATATINIYSANSDTPISLPDTVMTRLGTGLYYYPFNYGTFANGNYTGVFNMLNGTNYYNGVYPFTVNNGTADTGAISDTIGTITFVNGTTGTSGFLMWTPTNAITSVIYRADTLQGTFAVNGVVSGATGTYTDNTLRNQQDYYYYVVGVNASGYSAPSPIVNALVTADKFNYFTNTLDAIKVYLETQVTDLKGIYLGETTAFTFDTPFMFLIPRTKDEENVTVGYSGQVDNMYNVTFRIFENTMNNANTLGTVMSSLTQLEGKVCSAMESIKQYNPYWYNSDTASVEYGESIINEVVYKYVDINWIGKRRINRTT